MHVVYPGVYAVGHTVLTETARALAAVLACGPAALLSHRSAAALWKLLPSLTGAVDVLVPHSHRKGPRGIRTHETTYLPPHERTRKGVVPITTPARTLLDLAATGDDVERALNEAYAQRLIHPQALDALAASSRRGAVRLRALLADPPSLTRSEAERRLLALIARAGLPRPSTNARIGPYEVDIHWPAQRLVVEVDGYAYHASRAAFERDRARDGDLQARGLRVVRVTWRQLDAQPEAVAARLGAALAAGSN